MKSIFLSLLILAHFYTGLNAQEFNLLRNDSNSVKSTCYLRICYDQIKTGVVTYPELKFDPATINNGKIILLKSQGLPAELFFFRFEVSTHGSTAQPYIFCYNSSEQQYYQLGGFLDNETSDLFSYLEGEKFKMKSLDIQNGKIFVEGLDLLCLQKFYNSKKGNRHKSISETDLSRFSCLRYNFQPVAVY